MEKIGVTEFRRSLKDYLEEAGTTCGQIYEVGTETDVLLMAPATLERLQQRHFVNLWIRGRYKSLKLEQYPTLSGGRKTKDLSLEHLLALSDLFQLSGEVLDTLAHTGPKQNAMKWDISEYVNLYRQGKPLMKHGRFDTVYSLFFRLMEPWTIDQFRERKTLWEFFDFLRCITDMDKACRLREQAKEKGKDPDQIRPEYCFWDDEEYPHSVTFLKDYDASIEQMGMVQDGIIRLCSLMMELLSFQVAVGMEQSQDYPLLKCGPLFRWYEENVGELPKSFDYDPAYGI